MENDSTTTHSTQAATNEALAERAQAGDRDALAALWAQNRGLLGMMGRRYYLRYEQQATAAGVTLEDVEQEGYFIISEAARLYDPARGAFTTMLGLIVRRHIQDLVGLRRANPLNRAASLDAPVDLDNDESDTLGDLLPDPSAEDAEQSLEARQLHEDLEAALEQIPRQQAEVLRLVYWGRCTRKQVAERMGCTPYQARATEFAALAAMRRKARSLRAYLAEYQDAGAYRGTGFAAWSARGSVEERLMERLEDIRKAGTAGMPWDSHQGKAGE